MTQIFGYETASDSGVRIEDDRYIIRLAPESKVFEFATVSDVGKVSKPSLVYVHFAIPILLGGFDLFVPQVCADDLAVCQPNPVLLLGRRYSHILAHGHCPFRHTQLAIGLHTYWCAPVDRGKSQNVTRAPSNSFPIEYVPDADPPPAPFKQKTGEAQKGPSLQEGRRISRSSSQ